MPRKPVELSLTEMAVQAFSDAVAKVVEEHRREGRPLAVWRDGKAVWISADEAGTVRETSIADRAKPRGKES